MMKKEVLENLKPISWIVGTILSLIALFKVIIPMLTFSSPILANYERVYFPANIWLWNNNIIVKEKDSSVYYYNKNLKLNDSLIENELKYQNQIINNFIINRSLLKLRLVNRTDKIINNLEIIIPDYDNIGFKNELKYLSYKEDRFKYVKNNIEISEILPNDDEIIYISGDYQYLFKNLVENDRFKIKHGDETINFYPRKHILIENGIDLYFTNIIVGNKWLQKLGFIIIPLGIFLFFKIFIKIIRLTNNYLRQ